MFVRRNKELAQTVCILVLLATLGYSIFLYNSLQLKLRNTEIRSKKFESQHLSLSNQLQKIYADHARAQGLLELEKQEHGKTKKDFDSERKAHNDELDRMNSLHFDEKNQLKEEASRLQEMKSEIERNLNEQIQIVERLKSDKNLLERSHEEDLQLLQQQEENKQQNSDKVEELRRKEADLQASYSKSQEYSKYLAGRIDLLTNETNMYGKLKAILQSIGADVLNLDHGRLVALSDTDRSLLYRHFGSDDEQVKQLQNNRMKAQQLEDERMKALETQRLAKEERDRKLEMRASQNSQKSEEKPDQENQLDYNQIQEEKAKEELENQKNLMKPENSDQEPGEMQKPQEEVIEEIKQLQSVQQKIAEDQQANLLELQRHQDTMNDDAPKEPQEPEVRKYADEDESKVQLNEPPVAGGGVINDGQAGYIGAPQVAAAADDLKDEENDAELDKQYGYNDEEEEEDANVEYEEDNNDEDIDEDEEQPDDSKVWRQQEAGQAARQELQNLAMEQNDDF